MNSIQWKNGKKRTIDTKVAITPRIMNEAAASRRIFTVCSNRNHTHTHNVQYKGCSMQLIHVIEGSK